jgi:hypothetical protein
MPHALSWSRRARRPTSSNVSAFEVTTNDEGYFIPRRSSSRAILIVMQNQSRFLPLLALLPCIALLLGAQLSWPLISQWQGDLEIYARYADQIVQGRLPYRDFPVEYPPLALVPFVVPRLLALGRPLDETQYRLLFLFQNAFYLGLTAWTTLLIAHRGVFVPGLLCW